MAHMDSLTSLDRAVRRHFKKVLNRLSDQFFVREPMIDTLKVAPMVIEGPSNGWLMIGWHQSQPIAEGLRRFIDFNMALASRNFQTLKYLAIVDDQPSLFETIETLPPEVILVTQQEFYETGEDYILKHLVNVSDEQYAKVKKTLFAESAIHVQCTTRRQSIHHDNTASLQRFFLDYDQELATRFDMFSEADESEELEEDFSVRLINGVAGSGKTLILINRALLHCKKYPERQVLLISHNKPMISDIQYRLKEWLGGTPKNLTVQTFHAFALGQKKRFSGQVKPLFSVKDLKPLQDKVLSDSNEAYEKLTLSDAQLWGEIEYINEYLIKDQEDYLGYERQGRGFALQKSQRGDVWALYELAISLMSSEKDYLPSLYIRELALLDSTERLKKFDHVLVDEAQFFAPAWLQLVRQSLQTKGSIFLCADPNQGFLKNRLSWKSVGFNVRGRTKKLSYSYRTTYEIMVAANTLLEFMDDSLDDFVRPDLERMERGSLPQVIYSATTQDEQKRFINELKLCVEKDDAPLQQIMVLCSESYNPWTLKTLIEQVLGKETVVNCNDTKDIKNLGDRIRLMNINSCTGMESGITFVLGIGSLMNQANNLDLADDEREVTYQESIRKLYVAMTRAGQKLVLFSTEPLPECIKGLVEFMGSELETIPA